MKEYPSFKLLSCPVQLLTQDDLHELIQRSTETRQVVLGNQNLHCAALVRRDSSLKRFFDTVDYCWIDGMPFIWLARLCGFPAKREHRNTQLDWLPALLTRLAANRKKFFFIGSKQEIVGKIEQYLVNTYEGLEVHVHHGYISEACSDLLVRRINEIRPDMILLGMGMPTQELWLMKNRHRMSFGVAVPSGAIMEYFVGAQKAPTRVSGRLGLEWLIRLWNDPRRLSHRYLVEPWTLLFPAIADIWHYRIGHGRRTRAQFTDQVSSARPPV